MILALRRINNRLLFAACSIVRSVAMNEDPDLIDRVNVSGTASSTPANVVDMVPATTGGAGATGYTGTPPQDASGEGDFVLTNTGFQVRREHAKFLTVAGDLGLAGGTRALSAVAATLPAPANVADAIEVTVVPAPGIASWEAWSGGGGSFVAPAGDTVNAASIAAIAALGNRDAITWIRDPGTNEWFHSTGGDVTVTLVPLSGPTPPVTPDVSNLFVADGTDIDYPAGVWFWNVPAGQWAKD